MARDEAAAMDFLQEETRKVFQAFQGLGTDEKLALFYYVYRRVGDFVTPVAPGVLESAPILPMLLEDYFELSDDEQLQIMRDIVDRKDTEYSRAYSMLSENNQLIVWYTWAQSMGNTVVSMPQNYLPPQVINDALEQIERLDFQEQIFLLREAARTMGYSQVGEALTEAEVGTAPNLESHEVQVIIDLLREWAYGHPWQNQPFLVQMGRTWTPYEFYVEVAERTSFGEDFLRFLFAQAQRFNEKPTDCIRRTIEAGLL